MKQIVLNWAYYLDIIADDIHEYQMQFDKWLYNKENQHGYWVTIENPLDPQDISMGVCFNSDAFVTWLNDNILKEIEEEVVFVLRNIQLSDKYKDLPLLYF